MIILKKKLLMVNVIAFFVLLVLIALPYIIDFDLPKIFKLFSGVLLIVGGISLIVFDLFYVFK